jgi:hypothetical protein
MTTTTLSDRRRLGVRLLFVGVVLFVVAQEAVTLGHREPYPALFQPSFGNGSVTKQHTIVGDEPTMVVTYAGGARKTFDHLDINAAAKSSPLTTFRSTFGPTSPRRDKAATVAWLEQRLTDLGGGRRPVSAVLTWRNVAYHLDGDRHVDSVVTDRHTYTFGGGNG